MSKKDYIATAKIISAIKDKESRDQVALDFALHFKNNNHKFNSLLFIEACQPSPT